MATTLPILPGMMGARVGAIFVERKMRAAAVIVIKVRGHEAAQMALILVGYRALITGR